MQTLIKNNLDQEDPKFCLEYFKYETKKFFIHFSKDIAQNIRTERTYLENELKTLKLALILLITLNIPEIMKNLIRAIKKKQ